MVPISSTIFLLGVGVMLSAVCHLGASKGSLAKRAISSVRKRLWFATGLMAAGFATLVISVSM